MYIVIFQDVYNYSHIFLPCKIYFSALLVNVRVFLVYYLPLYFLFHYCNYYYELELTVYTALFHLSTCYCIVFCVYSKNLEEVVVQVECVFEFIIEYLFVYSKQDGSRHKW